MSLPLLTTLSRELSDLVERVRPSLVQVHRGQDGTGAGTIWHPDGLIVTNAHVVSDGPVNVTLSGGSTLPATVLARHTKLDIAALSIDATDLSTIEVGNSKNLRPGQLVLALGHPWGVQSAATAGIVISAGSHWHDTPLSGREMIAVDLPLRPGNSGGPLLNAEGKLIGVNTIMTGLDVGMAVPAHVIKGFLQGALGSRRLSRVA